MLDVPSGMDVDSVPTMLSAKVNKPDWMLNHVLTRWTARTRFHVRCVSAIRIGSLLWIVLIPKTNTNKYMVRDLHQRYIFFLLFVLNVHIVSLMRSYCSRRNFSCIVFLVRQRSAERERVRETETERERWRKTDRQRQIDRQTETDTQRDRDRQTQTDRDRHTHREGQTQTDRQTENEGETDTHTQRRTDREWGRERLTERQTDRERVRSRDRQTETQRDRERTCLWWSLCTLYLLACKPRVTAGDSELCCCAFER